MTVTLCFGFLCLVFSHESLPSVTDSELIKNFEYMCFSDSPVACLLTSFLFVFLPNSVFSNRDPKQMDNLLWIPVGESWTNGSHELVESLFRHLSSIFQSICPIFFLPTLRVHRGRDNLLSSTKPFLRFLR